MRQIKITILYNFIDGEFGGANQFLSALKDEWRAMGVYTDEITAADVVLINSHSLGGGHGEVFLSALCEKYYHRKKHIIHRLDGPVGLYRGTDTRIDRAIHRLSHTVADGVVFQSNYSKEMNYYVGMEPPENVETILNAPDPTLFSPSTTTRMRNDTRTKIIATSWSGHTNKGFETYHYLDKHLDFSRFSLTFVGNTDEQFQNIRTIGPCGRRELATLLTEHDIFLTASRHDPCSNSLIEGLHTGLPAVAYNGGGHPEIVGAAGILFTTNKEALHALRDVANNYERYRAQIELPDITAVATQYYNFCEQVRRTVLPKRLTLSMYLRESMWHGFDRMRRRVGELLLR